MPLIDATYFVAELNIPGAGTGTAIDTDILYKIREKESEFLVQALGRNLYRDFMNALGLDSDGNYSHVTSGLAENVDQKWIDLLNGKEYTDPNGFLRKWKGFVSIKDDSRTMKKSIIANYVYFEFLSERITQTTSFGEVATKAENADTVSPRLKLSRAWNQIHAELKELKHFLINNTSVYTQWQVRDGDKMMETFGFSNPFF